MNRVGAIIMEKFEHVFFPKLKEEFLPLMTEQYAEFSLKELKRVEEMYKDPLMRRVMEATAKILESPEAIQIQAEMGAELDSEISAALVALEKGNGGQ